MTPTSLRAGVVGAGLMGRWHAHAIQRMSEVGSSRWSIPDVERAETLAARLPHRPAVESDLDAGARERTGSRSCTSARRSPRTRRSRAWPSRPAFRCWSRSRSRRTRRRPRPCTRSPRRAGCCSVPCTSSSSSRGSSPPSARWPPWAPSGSSTSSPARPAPMALPRRSAKRWPSTSCHTGWRWRAGCSACRWAAWTGACPAGPPGEIRAMADVAGTSVMLAVSMRARPTENALTARCDLGTIRANLFHGYATIERGRRLAAGQARSAVLRSGSGRWVRRSAIWWGESFAGSPRIPGCASSCGGSTSPVRAEEPSPISVDESIDVARARDIIREARRRREPRS